jgi:Fic family protein
MNCYYSNLIEGHDTRPYDIQRARAGELSADPKRRDLQLEAVAHVEVQELIDRGALDDLERPSVLACRIHALFYDRLPDALRWAEDPDTGERHPVHPGELRQHGVKVGHHIPPDPEELPAWFDRLDEGAPERFGLADRAVVIAALHHRLLWVHPFMDGNGRVARLISHALLRRAGIGSPLWSVARGLARNVGAYRARLARADDPPQGMGDGRGILSDGRLANFCAFFLAAGLDQVSFMRRLLEPEALGIRARAFVAAEAALGRLDARLSPVLERAVLAGEVARSEIPGMLGTGDRQARRLLSPLVERGLLTGAKDAPLRIAFPLGESERLFPNLWSPSALSADDLVPRPDLARALAAT